MFSNTARLTGWRLAGGAVLHNTGGLTVAAVAGVANFTGCSITVAGTGYKLTASDTTHT